MLKILKYLSIVLLFSSCQQDQYAPTIDEEVLVKVVVDLQIAEEALKKSSGFEKDSLLIIYKDQIVNYHNINATTLEKDLVEMKLHPEYFQSFYEKVVERLEELEKPPAKQKDAPTENAEDKKN